jgi:hypothetical protein
VLDGLKAEREILATKALANQDVVRRYSFAAHAEHDAEATRQLSAARAESLGIDQRLREHDCAISEAELRLQQAQLVASRAADVDHAKMVRKAAQQFAEAGVRVDQALSALAHAGHSLVETHARLSELGVAFPSGAQLDALGRRPAPTRQIGGRAPAQARPPHADATSCASCLPTIRQRAH